MTLRKKYQATRIKARSPKRPLESQKDRSVRWAARKSGGLKSLSARDHSLISKSGIRRLTSWTWSRRQGAHCEVGSEGHEENHRVVIDGEIQG